MARVLNLHLARTKIARNRKIVRAILGHFGPFHPAPTARASARDLHENWCVRRPEKVSHSVSFCLIPFPRPVHQESKRGRIGQGAVETERDRESTSRRPTPPPATAPGTGALQRVGGSATLTQVRTLRYRPWLLPWQWRQPDTVFVQRISDFHHYTSGHE